MPASAWAIARTLHAAGYDVALPSLGERCNGLALELQQRGDSTLAVPAELDDTEKLPALIEQVLVRFGQLEVLVSNASAFFATPLPSATPSQWNARFAANAQAPFFLAQAALPALHSAPGAIVNLLDIYAERPLAEHPLYCMTRAALAAMTRSLTLDLAPAMRVNGVAPGAVLRPSDGKRATTINRHC